VDECLKYFWAVIKEPDSVETWSEWWSRNAELVRTVFPRDQYLRIKFRKLAAVRQILAERGLLNHSEIEYRSPEMGETRCHFCDRELFWAIPGQTTPEQIVAFAESIGREDLKRDSWIHPGVYCPNGCVSVLHHYLRPSLWKEFNRESDAT
jgi:hypothetical protein